jgi:hypothetical protein
MDRNSAVLAAIALIAVAATSSCAKPGSRDDEGAAIRPASAPITMEGKVAPAIVGTWKYILGSYKFGRDGQYDVHFDYMQPAGPGQPDKHVLGDDGGWWTADREYVYLKSGRGDVIRDKYTLSKDRSKLELYAKYAKTPEVLQRQKS